jgi:predicted nuclease of predicted toxin-antitoxin system
MQFLADESCDFAVVRALRAAGHDVKAVAEAALGATDHAVLELAVRERRVLLTEDKDFGQLVFAASRSTGGVIFIRFPATARSHFPASLLISSVQSRKGSLVHLPSFNLHAFAFHAGRRTAHEPSGHRPETPELPGRMRQYSGNAQQIITDGTGSRVAEKLKAAFSCHCSCTLTM